MSDQSAWRLSYLQARIQAGARATEVLALLLAAQDRDAAVLALADLLQVDKQSAQGVLDNWGTHLTVEDRAEAELLLSDQRREPGQGRP